MSTINDFADRVSSDVIGAPSLLVQRCVRDSIIGFCSDTWVMQRAFSATVSSINAALNNSATVPLTGITDVEDVKPVGILSLCVNNIEYKLRLLKAANHITNIVNDQVTKYYYFNYDNNHDLIIYPMNAGNIIFMVLAITPLLTADTIDTSLYDNWIEPIAYGAKAKLLSMPMKAWTDPQLAAYYLKEYKIGVNNARRKVRKNFTSESTEVNPRELLWL